MRIREMIGERQLKLTGHCICMPTDEPIDGLVLYESKVRPSLLPGVPTKDIDNKFRLTFYPARKRSKKQKYER